MFAVRQWPGNGADLDFRGVLAGCTAAIVAAAPIEGTLMNDDSAGHEGMSHVLVREAFLKSEEYKAVASVLPFCRLWCENTSPSAREPTHTPAHHHITRPLLSPDPGAWWRWQRCWRWRSR